MHTATRIRAASYVTRDVGGQRQLLIFDYPAKPDLGVHLPGGGIDSNERPDQAAIRETIEETGLGGQLHVLGVVGVQQGQYDNGDPCISVYVHLTTDEERDRWTHSVLGDPDAWDTGQEVGCRFVPLVEARTLLRASGYRQDEFVDFLYRTDS